jgi:hypothetical protein
MLESRGARGSSERRRGWRAGNSSLAPECPTDDATMTPFSLAALEAWAPSSEWSTAPIRWSSVVRSAAYPLTLASLRLAGEDVETGIGDHSCSLLGRRANLAGYNPSCACLSRCEGPRCAAALRNCAALDWCVCVSVNNERSWGTLKARAYERYGVEGARQDDPALQQSAHAALLAMHHLPRGKGMVFLLGEQKCGTTSLHQVHLSCAIPNRHGKPHPSIIHSHPILGQRPIPCCGAGMVFLGSRSAEPRACTRC